MTLSHVKKPALALYQPDIPQNVGAAMRLCACMGTILHIIHPCGFLWKDDAFRRTGMDYRDHVDLIQHTSWDSFCELMAEHKHRLTLLTTKTETAYTAHRFTDGDVLIMGRESAGVPDTVHHHVDARITIPMSGQTRSLNVINAASMVLGEALRQTGHI